MNVKHHPINTRCLCKYKPLFGARPQELCVLEWSPAGQHVRVQAHNFGEMWLEGYDIKVLEILPYLDLRSR